MSKMRRKRKSCGALSNTFGAGSGGCELDSRSPLLSSSLTHKTSHNRDVIEIRGVGGAQDCVGDF
jgi:hypothetical protein